MNIHLLEELLHEDESSSLDFKREQYKFDSEDDDARSELLKDILAFANAFRRSDAYILIGVEEIRGGRSIIAGVSEHLDDANLQQFINSKTQKPIEFSYETFSAEGKSLGIIRVPPQRRPFFCKKYYGKVKANEVYIRRGSSTAVANPDEIASMGEVSAIAEANAPSLDLEFADITLRKALGNSISLKSEFLEPLNQPQHQYYPFEMAVAFPEVYSSAEYKTKLIKHVADIAPFIPIGLRVRNTSSFLALDVRVEISLEKEDSLFLLDEDHYPSPPTRSLISAPRFPLTPRRNPMITAMVYDNVWAIIAEFGKVQPQAVVWSEDVFYIASAISRKVELHARLFADNLPNPKTVPLTIEITTAKRKMTKNDLSRFAAPE